MQESQQLAEQQADEYRHLVLKRTGLSSGELECPRIGCRDRLGMFIIVRSIGTGRANGDGMLGRGVMSA